MPKLMRKTVLLAKLETTSGGRRADRGGECDRGPRHQPATYRGRERAAKPHPAFFGNSEQLPVGIHSEIDLEVELAGSGAAGTAPAWGR